MASKLDQVLGSIDPDKTVNQISARADTAINKFSMNKAVIKDWQAFRKKLAKFYCHVEGDVLGIGTDREVNFDMHWGRCCYLLMKKWGNNGEKAAFEMARTGKEGGFKRVLETIAQLMIQEYATNEISSKALSFWNNLSVDEKLAVVDEYLAKYGHLLPDELKESNAVRLKAQFHQVLIQHPNMMKRLQNIGR